MEANGVADIVTVIQGAVEDIEIPLEEDNLQGGGDDERSEKETIRHASESKKIERRGKAERARDEVNRGIEVAGRSGECVE